MENHQQEKKLKSLWHASNCMSCGKFSLNIPKHCKGKILQGYIYRKFIYTFYSSLNLYFKVKDIPQNFVYLSENRFSTKRD